MSALPPEIINRIFELAAPPATFELSNERYLVLDACARVCRAWRPVAQRLLCRYPTIKTKPGEKGEILSWFNLFEGKKDAATVHHLRLRGCSDQFSIPSWTGTRLARSLKALSLESVTLDPYLLLELSSLQSLTISTVTFDPSGEPTSIEARQLQKLTGLSVLWQVQALPPWLRSTELPALQRLAIHSSFYVMGKDSDKAQYAFDDIVQLIPRLQFFSCGYGPSDSDYSNSSLSLCKIGAKTLFDLEKGASWMIYAYFEGSTEVKHIRIHSLGLRGGPEDKEDKDCWLMEGLNDLFAVTFPNLETLVVPDSWRHSSSHSSLKALADKQKVLILYEDGAKTGAGESLISEAFKGYMNRKEVANS